MDNIRGRFEKFFGEVSPDWVIYLGVLLILATLIVCVIALAKYIRGGKKCCVFFKNSKKLIVGAAFAYLAFSFFVILFNAGITKLIIGAVLADMAFPVLMVIVVGFVLWLFSLFIVCRCKVKCLGEGAKKGWNIEEEPKNEEDKAAEKKLENIKKLEAKIERQRQKDIEITEGKRENDFEVSAPESFNAGAMKVVAVKETTTKVKPITTTTTQIVDTIEAKSTTKTEKDAIVATNSQNIIDSLAKLKASLKKD
ncbi:MAG: hypothetical protein LBM01_03925 [Christensenellaceae bacterium]|jgi:hypothetical protein|nr:hypothetical protein [Christensenellaceae bacterium]